MELDDYRPGSTSPAIHDPDTGTTNLVKAEEDRKHPGLANLSHLDDDNIILLGEIYLNVKINNPHIALEFISALQ